LSVDFGVVGVCGVSGMVSVALCGSDKKQMYTILKY